MNETVLCCICVESAYVFIKIGDTDSKQIQWMHKLITSVPEIEWNENWIMCINCSTKLDSVYEFKIQCIKSEVRRKDQIVQNRVRINDNTCNLKLRHKTRAHKEDIIVDSVLPKQETFDDSTSGLLKLSEVRIIKKQKPSPQFQINKYTCRVCPSAFEVSTKLLGHMQEIHKSDPETRSPFACDKCDSTFNSSSNLMQHKKYHVGNRTHICSYCGKGFITKGDLNVHEKQHLNKREYECEICSKRFNTHKDIRSHKLVVHTDPKDWTYVCRFCDKRFPIKSNLDLHTRRHTGDKPFACHLCEKRFVEKIVLQKHIKSHSNVRAFKCGECNKEYKDKKILEIHLKKMHDIGDAKVPVRVKKYFCSVCPKSYFAKNKLTRHMCSHTGIKPYCCEICQKKFTDKSYVKQHLKTVHNVYV